jgi:hypothetical protein
MRGRESSHRDLLRSASSQQAGGGDSTRPVVSSDDLENLPVTPEELDAIEAFLMPQILLLLETGDCTKDDSKRPKTGEIVPETEGALS